VPSLEAGRFQRVEAHTVKILSNNVLRNISLLLVLAACANSFLVWEMLAHGGEIPFELSSRTVDLVQNLSTITGLAGGLSALVIIRPAWAEITFLLILVPIVIITHYLFMMAVPSEVKLTYTLEDFSVYLVLLEAPTILTVWAAIGLTWASYLKTEQRRA
jgi:hypothetical protein